MNVNVYMVATSDLVDGVNFYIERSSGERNGEEAMDHGMIGRKFVSVRV